MVKNENVRIVVEDAVLGNGCNYHEFDFTKRDDGFRFPLTVSFCAEGEYRVIIKGKTAIVTKEN